MRQANFTSGVLYPLLQKLGIDPAVDFQVNLAAAYATFINIAVVKLHDRFDFSDWVLIEQRTPDANHYISFEQPGLTTIHRALKVFQRDPRVTIPQCDVPFRLDNNGIHVGYDHGTNVWVRFMEPAPQFTTTLYDSAKLYFPLTLVYDPVTGECFKCIYPAQNQPPHAPIWSPTVTYAINQQVYDPSFNITYKSKANGNLNHNLWDPATPTFWDVSSNSNWELVEFPESVADLVVRYAFSEALREDGQFDKANAEEQAVIQEAIGKVAGMINLAFDPISDQARPASRYRLPIAIAGGTK